MTRITHHDQQAGAHDTPPARAPCVTHSHPKGDTTMKTSQGNTIRSLVNAQEFIRTNAAELGGVDQTDTMHGLDTTITDVADHVTNQNGTARTAKGAAVLEATLRADLVTDHMAPLNRIAKLKLKGIPQLAAFRMPRGRPTTQQVAAHAQGMSRAAAPYAATFISAGMPADFLAQFDSSTAAMLQAQKDRASSQGTSTGATAGLQKLLSTGRQTVHVLDMFIRKTLKNNPTLLASWKAAQRVPKAATRSTTQPAPEAPATPAPATPAPVVTAPVAPAAA